MSKTIHTMKDLREEFRDSIGNYDPFTWESLGMDFDDYVDRYTECILDILEEEHNFKFGEDLPDLEYFEWRAIMDDVEQMIEGRI